MDAQQFKADRFSLYQGKNRRKAVAFRGFLTQRWGKSTALNHIVFDLRRLNVSIDYLLDNGEEIDLTVVREPIELETYYGKQRIGKRCRRKKAVAKDYIVREKYQAAEIHYLIGDQILTKEEKVVDNLVGFLTGAPVGIPALINQLKNTDKEFYLVIDGEKQFLITATDEFIESRQLSRNISERKFVIGGFKFVDCGVMPK